MDERLGQLDDKQMDIMMRLQNLSEGVEALKNKTEMNRRMAIEAKDQANNATRMASSLEKVRSACCEGLCRSSGRKSELTGDVFVSL